MEAKDLLKFCIEKGFLLDKETLNLFSDTEDLETVKLVIERIGQQAQTKILTKHIFEKNKEKLDQIFLNLPDENQKTVEKLKVRLGISIEISKEIIKETPVEPVFVLKEENKDMGGVKVVSLEPVLSKKIEVYDFTKYFKNRFVELREILKSHSELNNLISINKLYGNKMGISLIGIVYDKRVTKNKNILLELEDLTGKVVALINKNSKDLYEKAEEVAIDSVIGVKCSGSREIVFVSDIIFPDAFISERKKSPVEEYVLFTGDLHVGSKLFMEDNFLKFIDYLNDKSHPEVSKIKYLFIGGDLIAGVGIYPGQEKELTLPDVEEQYARAAELLSKIRKDIIIIISPGNHDALRIMEPQPLLDEKYAWPIYSLKNVILTSNPSLVNIGSVRGFSGFNVLSYHGYSFHYYANNVPRLMKEKAAHQPEKIISYLLKHRHLAPTHASTLYFPSERDSLLIREVPDIFLSAHTHKSAVSYYNNILIISSSSWESLTAYQEKMGNEPDFCKVPMFNLKTRAIKILDFE